MTPFRLRPVEAEDVPLLAGMLAHPDLVGRRGLDGDRPVARSVAALEKSLSGLVDPEDGDAWVVEVGEPIGLATAGWWWDALTPWANVVIHPAHQRRGHGTAAAHAVFEHLFEATPALLVEYAVPSWDEAGLVFAESLGGTRIGVRRRTGVRHGRYHDNVEFALLRTTWEEHRAVGR